MNELIKRLEMELAFARESYEEETGREKAYFQGQVEALENAIEMAKEY